MTKRRRCANGTRGGKAWTKGAVYKVLANPVYLGQAVHKGIAYPGEHAAIIEQRTWRTGSWPSRRTNVAPEPGHSFLRS
jgi:hypothetical protein